MIDIDGSDEQNVQIAILQLMADRRVWTNSDLKKKIKFKLKLSSHDKERSQSRPMEVNWENRVNNALSPSRTNSLYASGRVKNCGLGKHQITDTGFKFVNEVDPSLEDLFSAMCLPNSGSG